MRKTIVAFAGVAVLASWGPAMADLCGEKKAGLAKLEAEAPGLHAKVAKLEADYAAASALENKALLPGTLGELTTPRDTLLDNVTDTGMRGASAIARANRKRLEKELDSAKGRESYVANQIFLLRDMIEGLGGCGAQAPAPPVDYNAIDQHIQQSQQAGPGGTPQAGSGAFGESVVPQGAYATPSSGFGTPETPAQTPGSQGYGPGPYDTGSPRVSHTGIEVEGSLGGETGGESAKPGEPPMEKPKPPMEKHKKKPM